MDRLTPAERIDLKADLKRIAPLVRTRNKHFWELTESDKEIIDVALYRYPALVELVRRLSEDAGTLSSRSRVWTECRKRERKSGMLVDSRGGRPKTRRKDR